VKVVLDTNVLVSGLFFAGPPRAILEAWHVGRFCLLISPDILHEYERVGLELAQQFPGIDISAILDVLATGATLLDPPPSAARPCEDPGDIKFLACAVAGRADYLISGDKHLLKLKHCERTAILKPREFVDAVIRQAAC
jgi:putative PIN family toxin of toxin-antitoxin system